MLRVFNLHPLDWSLKSYLNQSFLSHFKGKMSSPGILEIPWTGILQGALFFIQDKFYMYQDIFHM